MTGLMLPKSVKVQRIKPLRYTNPKHLDWLHDWSCALAGKCECEGPTVAHHLLNPWIGARGMGRKADDRNVIALCDGHHRELHARGDEDAFWKEQTGYPEFGRIWSERLWNESPFREVL